MEIEPISALRCSANDSRAEYCRRKKQYEFMFSMEPKVSIGKPEIDVVLKY